MSVNILISMFKNDFPVKFAERLNEILVNRNKFAFVASEFNDFHEKNDEYFKFSFNKFINAGICFANCCIVDDRMTKEQARLAIEDADVVWLSGGDTPTQFKYLKEYGLDSVLKNHRRIVIGMSAGAINMAKTAICTVACGHQEQKIYNALKLVDISIEPHFDCIGASDELLELSNSYCIYGLCDDAAIICKDKKIELLGDVYIVDKQEVNQISYR